MSPAESGCAACGAAGGRETEDAGSIRIDCGTCGSATFRRSSSAGTTEYYRNLYDESGDLAARAGRARVELLATVGVDSAPPCRLRTSDVAVLERVGHFVQRGQRVLDWGCGSGRVLQRLRRRGYDAVGVDVVEGLVDHLAAAGMPAVLVDEASDLGPAPGLIICLELLEHLENPVQLLQSWRQRWPTTDVIVSVPSPDRIPVLRGEREQWDRPPEHMVRFTQDGLGRLLERSGYRPSLHVPEPAGRDRVPRWWKSLVGPAAVVWERLQGSRQLRRVSAIVLLWAHAAFVRIGYVLGTVRLATTRTPPGSSAESMFAIGSPDPGWTGPSDGLDPSSEVDDLG